ncbi:uncharacterized protein LOC135383543 [Ornithodoros turicata]|uniref:uncharacterized protein LOC135383543 n=1 Tax=Ornithodoros turicata TaxID=34597 RepID=UPI00313930C5
MQNTGPLFALSHLGENLSRNKELKKKMLQCCGYCCAAAGFMVSATLVTWLFYGIRARETPVSPTRAPFCCPNHVRRLSDFANRSMKPCEDFYLYTCFAFRENSTEAFLLRQQNNDIVRQILHGDHQDHASQALIRIMDGCVATVTGTTDEVVVASLRLATKILSISVSSSPATVLEAILETSSHYQLWPILKIYYILQSKSSAALLLENRKDSHYKSYNAISSQQWRRALQIVNSHYNTNVSRLDITAFYHDITTATPPQSAQQQVIEADDDISVYYGPSVEDKVKNRLPTTLDIPKLFPEVGAQVWKEALSALGYWSHSITVYATDRGRIGYALRLLTSPGQRAQALAYYTTLLAATIAPNMWAVVQEKNLNYKNTYCSLYIQTLNVLWEMAFAHVLTDPQKDEVVRALFYSVVRVIEDSASSIVHKDDVPKFLSLVRSVTLQVPSDRMSPDLKIMTTPTTFWGNILSVRRFKATYYQFLAKAGYNNYYPKDKTTSPSPETRVLMKKTCMYVPPLIYNYLLFENGTDPLINAATVGVQMSNHIWDLVFSYRNWSIATQRRLDGHIQCIKRNFANAVPSLAYPRLSIMTAVQVSVFPRNDWNTPIQGWSMWKIPRSQVFYMTYFVRNVCMNDTYKPSSNTTKLMTSFRDFKYTFECINRTEISGCLFDDMKVSRR